MDSKKIGFLVFLTVLAVPAVSAQTTQEASPGLVTADNPVYGLELAYDNARMAVGLADPGNVAVERAAEARQAIENGDTDAGEQAAQALNRTAERATERNRERLQEAEKILEQVRNEAPSEAREGLNTALDGVRKAQDRVPEDAGPGEDAPGPR